MNPIQRFALSLRSNIGALGKAPYTQLLIASDLAGWSLDEDAREMIETAGALNIPARLAHRPWSGLPQCVHYTSFFSLTDPAVFNSKHRISVDYYHGKPEQDPSFRVVFEAVKKNAGRIHKVRLSYSAMKPLLLSAGIPENRLHVIPIGFNPIYFRPQTPELRCARRAALGIPESATVIGSFQKDGQGWHEGLEPKWVKGPDVFLQTLALLKPQVPELFVLLTGPARGYVKKGLDALGIPYRHFFPELYSELGNYYEALDVYLVASREEGGPKAILESMGSGVPIVSTRVGQAQDLVLHGKNGFLAEVEDARALSELTLRALAPSAEREALRTAGLQTAQAHTPMAQRGLWRSFFTDYIEHN